MVCFARYQALELRESGNSRVCCRDTQSSFLLRILRRGFELPAFQRRIGYGNGKASGLLTDREHPKRLTAQVLS